MLRFNQISTVETMFETIRMAAGFSSIEKKKEVQMKEIQFNFGPNIGYHHQIIIKRQFSTDIPKMCIAYY